MKSSLTCTFTGTSAAALQSSFCPEIILDDEYSCALLDFSIINAGIAAIESSEIYINCDIISDSYINGKQSQTIHQFIGTSIAKNRKLVEAPSQLNYFPVKVKRLQSIHISIVDKKGELIDTKGGHIICRIRIRRDKNSIPS